jgi:putative tryptophan/tyrosine transport system substrate-binding protein
MGMRRREFILLLGSAAAAWPLAARAQQRDRVPRIGVYLAIAEDDPEAPRRIEAFRKGLQELGWTEGRNVGVEYRFGAADAGRIATQVAELVALKPDVIVGNSTPVVTALRQATRSIPVVFVQIIDPVGGGLVESLARPGGNMTGFSDFEFGTASKWLELLKEIAPSETRAAVLMQQGLAPNIGFLRALEDVAPSLGVQLTAVRVRDAEEIERGLDGFACQSNGGLIVLPSPVSAVHRDTVIKLAVRHRLRAIYPFRYFVLSGGLLSYGVDNVELYRRGASYVDRILKGASPADLPVQHPTKFEIVINLRTAKALGLDIPPTLLARADEVIE